jgi:ribosomal protein S27E
VNEAIICNHCNEVVIKSMNGEAKLRSKVVIFRDDQAFAICKGCNSELPIPVKLDVGMMKSITESNKVRLFIKR